VPKTAGEESADRGYSPNIYVYPTLYIYTHIYIYMYFNGKEGTGQGRDISAFGCNDFKAESG